MNLDTEVSILKYFTWHSNYTANKKIITEKIKRKFFPSSVQFSRSVVSDSLRLHEPQHARPPCPSPAPRVYPNPCPLSRWCHPTISSSAVPFSSCPQSFLASGSFQTPQLPPKSRQWLPWEPRLSSKFLIPSTQCSTKLKASNVINHLRMVTDDYPKFDQFSRFRYKSQEFKLLLHWPYLLNCTLFHVH